MKLCCALAALIVAGAFSHAAADVRMKHHTQMLGMKAVGDFDTKSTDVFSGMKKRAESVVNITGGVAGFLTKKDKASTVITRVDKGVQWTLEPDDKEYKELSLDELAEKMKKLRGKEESTRDDGKKVRFEVKVETPSDRQTIAGHEARHGRILITTIEDDVKENTSKEVSYITADLWFVEEGRAAFEEVEAYNRAYATRIGLGDDMQENPLLSKMMAGFGPAMKEMSAKLKGLGGMPVKTETMIEAPGGVEKAEQKNEEHEESSSMSLGGALGGLFGGGKKERHEEKTEETLKPTAPGRHVIMKITDEVLEFSTSSEPGDLFEIPAGWSKD